MIREPFRTLTARTVQLVRDDIDTDQIIPARFLTTVVRDGLGKQLFADWRYDANGKPRESFALNHLTAPGAQILMAGRNFGCGSSREHAAWALLDWGFRVVIAPSFADIFRSNANRNGLVTVALEPSRHERLCNALERNRFANVTVDLEAQIVRFDVEFAATFPVDPFVKRCLCEGLDELGYLLAAENDIRAFETRRPRTINTRAVVAHVQPSIEQQSPLAGAAR